MSILKRRLDICGREKVWTYLIEVAGSQYEVTGRQVGRNQPVLECSCGAVSEGESGSGFFGPGFAPGPCLHIAEALRDLSLTRQAAAQMLP